MDRKVGRQAGFSLIELLIVVAIIGIISAGVISSKNHARAVNSVNDDLHSMSLFLKRLRMDAFTRKVDIQVTVAVNQITTIIDPAGAATPGRRLTMQNDFLVTGSPFSITRRGTFGTTGNIRLDYAGATNPPTGTKYSCLAIDNVRIRLGEIDTTTVPETCDAI